MPHYDVIIIGGGPAGLTAGLYTSRARLATLLLEKAVLGGQVIKSDQIENYPGFEKSISGFQLMRNLEQQALHFGLTIETGNVRDILLSQGNPVRVLTGEGDFSCDAVIIATGSDPTMLGVAGEEKLIGRGVSYCATCDGAFFKDKEVAVVGGGDAAIEEALFLARLVRKVHIIHRRNQLRAIKILQERAFADSRITFHWDTVVQSIEGEDRVRALTLKRLTNGATLPLFVDAVFIYVGLQPNTHWLAHVLPLTPQGFIQTDEHMATILPGVYAAGDVRKKLLRQIATAVGDGSTAACAVEKYLQSR